MVLPTYQSLTERGSHESLPVHSGRIMRMTSNASSIATSPSSLNLSALTLSDAHQSAIHLGSNNQRGQQATLRRGWGSTETRRASTSLCTMASQTQEYQRQAPGHPPADTSTPAHEKDGWGYFVDVGENDEEEALMW